MVSKKVTSKKKVAKKAVAKKVVTKKPVVKKATKKKVTKKPAAKKKAVAKKPVAKSLVVATVSNEQRYKMVAEAAYHLAEKQSFNPDNDINNWLQAEKQIDAKLKSGDI